MTPELKTFKTVMEAHLKTHDIYLEVSNKLFEYAKESEDPAIAILILAISREYEEKARISMQIAKEAVDSLMEEE
jgi:hypothetical protein